MKESPPQIVWVLARSDNYRRKESLYWSNELGWVDFDSCDKFKEVPEGYARPMDSNLAVSTT